MSKEKEKTYFDFEKPIQELEEQLEKAMETHEKGKVNMQDNIDSLNKKILKAKKEGFHFSQTLKAIKSKDFFC